MLDDHAATDRVEVGQADGPRPEHEEPGRTVVGHRVEERDLPVGDPRIDDLDRRHCEVDRSEHLGGGRVGVGQIIAEHEGDLGLDLGLDQPADGDLGAVFDRHVGEQHAVVRLVDAQLALDGERREADLAADEAPSALDPMGGVDVLDRVGLLDRGDRVLDRRDR